jgi:acetolactate synthase regulatory subunit
MERICTDRLVPDAPRRGYATANQFRDRRGAIVNTLQINFRPTEGALIRILGVIEEHGFRLGDLTVRDEDSDGSIIVDFQAKDHARRVDVLAHDVGQLVDVKSVLIGAPVVGPYA